MFYIFPHTTEQDSQPITSLISKQAIPYQICGGTYCPGVSTSKTRSLADLSMTIHNTWWNPTISTIPTHAQTTASNLTTVTSHHDGWKVNTQHSTQAKLNIIKMERLVQRLKTARLSNTTNHKNPILKYEGLDNQLMHAASEY
jgi:hypothetical protein